MAGRVVAGVETEADVSPARDEIARTDMGRVPAERVDVVVSKASEEHSYGGLSMNDPLGSDGCTSGFTVVHIASNIEGVVDAGHCPNQERFAHHLDVTMTREDEKNADSADAQWFRTPWDDTKEFRYNNQGDVRGVYGRKDRSNMVVNQQVCKFGKMTGEGCAYIKEKNFDKDINGSQWSATFIRMDRDITDQGDSGGPWFLVDTAYGIHTGTTTCDPTQPGTSCDSYFMAQNYLESSLGVQVRIHS